MHHNNAQEKQMMNHTASYNSMSSLSSLGRPRITHAAMGPRDASAPFDGGRVKLSGLLNRQSPLDLLSLFGQLTQYHDQVVSSSSSIRELLHICGM